MVASSSLGHKGQGGLPCISTASSWMQVRLAASVRQAAPLLFFSRAGPPTIVILQERPAGVEKILSLHLGCFREINIFARTGEVTLDHATNVRYCRRVKNVRKPKAKNFDDRLQKFLRVHRICMRLGSNNPPR
jgi:hypothetical protein